MSDAVGVHTTLNRAPTIGTPSVSRVSNSTSQLTISATATDEDEGDTLTYKLLRGTSSSNITETTLTPTNISGRTVTFTDTGLSANTTYYYKIQVSDGIDNATSANYGSNRTYCLGSYCSGGGINHPDCPDCDGGKLPCTNSSCTDGKVTCSTCRGKL